jgi:hypothetical protein
MKTKLPKTISLRTIIHGEKVKADSEHGKMVCREVVAYVKALTGIEGQTEYQFDTFRKWRLDVAYPSHLIALELNGWTSHHRRGRMEADNIKLASAIRMGWRVFYATEKQARKEAALWIAVALEGK